jgi:hypothetical protein
MSSAGPTLVYAKLPTLGDSLTGAPVPLAHDFSKPEARLCSLALPAHGIPCRQLMLPPALPVAPNRDGGDHYRLCLSR